MAMWNVRGDGSSRTQIVLCGSIEVGRTDEAAEVSGANGQSVLVTAVGGCCTYYPWFGYNHVITLTHGSPEGRKECASNASGLLPALCSHRSWRGWSRVGQVQDSMLSVHLALLTQSRSDTC